MGYVIKKLGNTGISHEHCSTVGVNIGLNLATSIMFNMLRVVRPRGIFIYGSLNLITKCLRSHGNVRMVHRITCAI